MKKPLLLGGKIKLMHKQLFFLTVSHEGHSLFFSSPRAATTGATHGGTASSSSWANWEQPLTGVRPIAQPWLVLYDMTWECESEAKMWDWLLEIKNVLTIKDTVLNTCALWCQQTIPCLGFALSDCTWNECITLLVLKLFNAKCSCTSTSPTFHTVHSGVLLALDA